MKRQPIGDPARRGDFHACARAAGGWSTSYRVDVFGPVRRHVARAVVGVGVVCSALAAVVVV